MSGPSRLQELFERAVELPEDERAAFVRGACGGDTALEARVRALLEADGARGPTDVPLPLLFEPLLADEAGGAPAGEGESPAALEAGARVGPYRVVRELGRGGMGVVYLAERADGAFEQAVALKLVHAGLIAGELQRRFLRERNILARLDHPGIARLLHGGVTAGGHPYLAMQLVEGEPITAWAEGRGLDLAARLRLFLEVCDAVRYAHGQLVIHRDLKPSNIQVTREGAVRLLDFGIARLVDEPESAGEATRTGLLLLTPEYAAPEQLRGEPATVATDVYALGAVLYQLLARRRPFETSARSWSEIVRILAEEPPPVTIVTRGGRSRRDADLEAIVARALRKEPERRYPSVDALADDIRAYLDGRPVRARPDSRAYRARRFVRRNALGVGAAAALLAALVAGLAGTTWMATAARREAARAEAVTTFLFGLWEAADPDLSPSGMPTVLELVDRGVERIDSLPAGAGPEVRVDMMSTLGWLYRKLGAYDRAVAVLERAAAEARAAFGVDERTGHALDGLAQSLIEAGDYERAEAVAREGIEVRRAAGSPPAALSGSYTTLGVLLSMLDRHAEALATHERALELDLAATGPGSAAVATDLGNLASVRRRMGELEEAERGFREVVRIRRGLPPGERSALATALGQLASVRRALGDFDEAEALEREGLELRIRHFGPEHPDVAISLDQLAVTLQQRGHYEPAESLLVRALDLRERVLGEEHPARIDALNNLATLRFLMGRYRWAVEAQEPVVAARRRTHGDEHAQTATAVHNLGVMRLGAGDLDGAERDLAEGLAVRRRVHGGESAEVAASLRWLAELRREQGRPGEAERLGREALALFRARLPADHPRVAEALLVVGSALVEAGREGEAVPLLADAVGIREGVFPKGGIPTAEAHAWLGIALARSGDTARARQLLEGALEAYEAAGRSAEVDAVRARDELARLVGARAGGA